MNLGKQLPFLRWSFIRLGFGMKHLLKEWQVGDGREEACAQYVLANAQPGSIDAAIQAIDEFAYRKKFLINVGDEKGEILDSAVKRVRPNCALELGCYVGYSALRIARNLSKEGHLFSVEFNAANAAIARRILAHAGVQKRVTVIVGTLGDGGATLQALKKAIGPGKLDFAFVDHAKEEYLPDLRRLTEAGFFHSGSVVVADNVRFPGAPEYKAFMEAEEGKTWKSIGHETHAEYQTLIKDLVLESTFL